MNIIDDLDKFSASRIMIEVIKMLAVADVGRASDALSLYKMIHLALENNKLPQKNRAIDNARREAYRKTDSKAITNNNPFGNLNFKA